MYKRATRRSRLLLSAHVTAAIILMTGVARAADLGAQFVHFVTVESVGGGASRIDHPLTNDDQSAIIHVTQCYNPGGVGGVSNDHVVGLAYSDYDSKWMIVNHDASTPGIGAAFNIWVPPADAFTFLHTATPATITSSWTTIDNPLTNGNPGAILRVTQNANPVGGAWIFNDHVVGVWYDGSKWAVFNQGGFAMTEDASFNVTVLLDDPTVSIHTATPANTAGGSTYIDHPFTNNNPNAIVSITQNWNPGGIGGVPNDHVLGLWYYHGFEKWGLYNQDGAPMPEGASFNVSVPSLESAEFVHLADTVNTTAWATYVDHPLSNDNPHALLFVNQNWNPGGGAGGIFNDHSLGVWYSHGLSRWTVVNQDSADIPVGASFNVSIPAADASTFVHGATAETITLNWTTINHPITDGNPNAVVHVTQNHNPSGVGGVSNDHTIGVWYDGARWAIFNQDHAAMPVGAFFNVSIPADDAATFVHTADSGNIFNNWTNIDNPITNGHPDAILRVTQNWNPPASPGIYNDHEIGVVYTGSGWAIFNQDLVEMPEGASFNVTVGATIFSDGFESGNTGAWSTAVP